MEYESFIKDRLYVTMEDGTLLVNQMVKAHMVNIVTLLSFFVCSLFITYEYA